jgi:hypothetical protein
LASAFCSSDTTIEEKLESFTKYTRRQALTRFLAQSDLVRRIVGIEGSIVECGVHRGASLFGWYHLVSIFDPMNWRRKIYGFDTFAGFASVTEKDIGSEDANIHDGCYGYDAQNEIESLALIHDNNRPLGHLQRIELIRGDATSTIPTFLKTHPHIIIALLFLDCDLYAPTKSAIENFVPRLPKGGIIVFDELNHSLWPGETLALLDTVGINNLKLERLQYYPNMTFAIL